MIEYTYDNMLNEHVLINDKLKIFGNSMKTLLMLNANIMNYRASMKMVNFQIERLKESMIEEFINKDNFSINDIGLNELRFMFPDVYKKLTNYQNKHIFFYDNCEIKRSSLMIGLVIKFVENFPEQLLRGELLGGLLAERFPNQAQNIVNISIIVLRLVGNKLFSAFIGDFIGSIIRFGIHSVHYRYQKNKRLKEINSELRVIKQKIIGEKIIYEFQ